MYKTWPTDKLEIEISGNGDGSMRARARILEGEDYTVIAGNRLVIEASGGKQVTLREEKVPPPVSLLDKRKALLSLLLHADPDADLPPLCDAIIKIFEASRGG